MPAVRAVALLAGLLAVLGVTACGDGGDPQGEGATVTTGPTTTTTSLPPGGRQPTPDEPLRVTFGGDSVMAELASAATAALGGGGATDARFLLAPSLAREGAGTELIWRREIEQHDPELVVVLVGFWEEKVVGDEAFDRPDFVEHYRAEVVEPFLDLVGERGARVLWIGMAAARDPVYTAHFQQLNHAYESAARERPTVDYLPAGRFLAGPEGGFAETVVSEDAGRSVRLRRTDGLHLCPEGVVRLGAPVLTRIAEQWNVPVVYGWQAGEWRRPPLLNAPEECPDPAA